MNMRTTLESRAFHLHAAEIAIRHPIASELSHRSYDFALDLVLANSLKPPFAYALLLFLLFTPFRHMLPLCLSRSPTQLWSLPRNCVNIVLLISGFCYSATSQPRQLTQAHVALNEY
jgi:hypothetical protein